MSVHLIGGEMPLFSDLDAGPGPGPVRGRPLGTLTGTLMGAVPGRVLVVGPHHGDVLDAVIPDATDQVTVLVRSLPDAEVLADRYADRPGVTVCCGGLDKLPVDPPYDTVVALDGFERLCSADSAALAWQESLALLLAAVRPGGTLLLGLANHLGVHRLTALPGAPTDADWLPAGDHDRTRPPDPVRLTERLRHAGWRAERTYTTWPRPHEVDALLGPDLLADDEVRGFVEATLTRLCRPTRPVLSDPVRLTVDALRRGLAVELAPGWIVVARRDTPSATVDDGGPLTPWPDAVVDDGGPRPAVLRRSGDRWVSASSTGEPAAALPPVGRTLQDLLLTACLERDLPAVRELLRTWQSGGVAGVPADAVVVGPGGGLTALAATTTPAAAVRRLAATILSGGFAHPWPTPRDEADLAVTLTAMAGLAPQTAVDVVPDEARVPAVHDLIAERDRLLGELAEARAQIAFHERLLARRDDELVEARRTVELLGDRGPARLGRVFVGGVRAARRTTRTVVRRLRD